MNMNESASRCFWCVFPSSVDDVRTWNSGKNMSHVGRNKSLPEEKYNRINNNKRRRCGGTVKSRRCLLQQ
jgi:hypothetical protein